MAKFDKNKDYYQILGVSRDATADQILRNYNAIIASLKQQLDSGYISKDNYDEYYEMVTEAADVLVDPITRDEYDRARVTFSTTDNSRKKVTSVSDGTSQAKKGRNYFAGISITAAVLALLITLGFFSSFLYSKFAKNNKDIDLSNPDGYEQALDDFNDSTDVSDKETVKNFGSAISEKDIKNAVNSVSVQLDELGVVNPQTGIAYTDEELTSIIQYINGAYLPEKESEAYTMTDNYLNLVAGIISSQKTLNMIQYQANSDVVTKDIVKKDLSVHPFDFSSLLMGDSYCYDVIEHFNDSYAKLLSTTDRDEFISIHNSLYQDLAELMYGDGLVVNGKKYTIKDFEGLQNLNDAAIFNFTILNIMPFHVEGIKTEFQVFNSQAGNVIVPIAKIDEQFNALCDKSDYKIDENGNVFVDNQSNFATITQIQMINSSLQNYNLGNTDSYNDGYGFTKN